MSDTNYAISDKHMNIDINIIEGSKYYFRDIKWEGNFIYDDATLSNVLGVKKGDIYDLELIQTKLNYDPTGIDISSLYHFFHQIKHYCQASPIFKYHLGI